MEEPVEPTKQIKLQVDQIQATTISAS